MGYENTWDNPADAYRHFAWNWFNSRDIGVNKARKFGDNHEVALAAANYMDINYPNMLFSNKVTAGLAIFNIMKPQSKASLSNFNDMFDNPTIMDIHNNSWGRKCL